MKRSASLSDLPSLSVSDDDEDEPMEKKVKLVSAPPPAENALPVSRAHYLFGSHVLSYLIPFLASQAHCLFLA